MSNTPIIDQSGNGTPERVAFDLMEKIDSYEYGAKKDHVRKTREELLSLYEECYKAVIGTRHEDFAKTMKELYPS